MPLVPERVPVDRVCQNDSSAVEWNAVGLASKHKFTNFKGYFDDRFLFTILLIKSQNLDKFTRAQHSYSEVELEAGQNLTETTTNIELECVKHGNENSYQIEQTHVYVTCKC